MAAAHCLMSAVVRRPGAAALECQTLAEEQCVMMHGHTHAHTSCLVIKCSMEADPILYNNNNNKIPT